MPSNDRSPSLEVIDFGNLPDGTSIEQYVLKAANGITAKVITYGGVLTSLLTPDKHGNMANIVVGFDSIEGYLKANEQSNPYLGAIVGRYCNRISRGKFELEGKSYDLAVNNGPNHLHGGTKGFDKVVWQAEKRTKEDAVGVSLSYTSPDMEEGYPGELKVKTTYWLSNEGELGILYEATTTRTTVINLTNHSYFNLTGSNQSILDHQLQINADTFLPIDECSIPLGKKVSVKNSPFDFTGCKAVGKDINTDDLQLKYGNGYDHTWILNSSDDSVNFAAQLYEAQSGRVLKVYTTEPGVQFYTGNFLDVNVNGKEYKEKSALCFETQHFPDSPNRPDFPSTILKPGEIFKSTTKFIFQTK